MGFHFQNVAYHKKLITLQHKAIKIVGGGKYFDHASAGARPTEPPPENFTWGPLYPQAKYFDHASAGARPTEPPPENFTWGPLYLHPGIGGFTQTAIFIRRQEGPAPLIDMLGTPN